MAISSSSGSSSGKRTRMLEVEVKSATLNAKNKEKSMYVKLWINETTKLQTTNHKAPTFLGKFSWNQKFVFSIPQTFPLDKDSLIVFEVFRARKMFPDSLLGTALCHVEPLFKEKEKEREQMENLNNATAKYDTEEEGEEEEKEKEVVKEKEKLPEVKVSAQVPIMFSKGFGARVFRSLEVKGFLEVEMVVWRGFLSRVGEFNWHNLAMEYDEFMGLKSGGKFEKEKKKHHHLWCFANSYTAST